MELAVILAPRPILYLVLFSYPLLYIRTPCGSFVTLGLDGSNKLHMWAPTVMAFLCDLGVCSADSLCLFYGLGARLTLSYTASYTRGLLAVAFAVRRATSWR